MKKTVLLSLFILATTAYAFSQEIEQEDMVPLFKFLAVKNWDSSFVKANELIKKFPADSSDYKALTNYAAILSAAGKVSNDRMSYKELKEILRPFLGKRLLMPARPTTTDTLKIANHINTLKENPSGIKGISITNDVSGKTILCFENFEFKDHIHIEDFDKQKTICGGKLYSVELNRYEDKIWIMRLFIIDATIRKI